MKLLFQQRLFSWLDSYDVYNEIGGIVFTVKGRLAFGHCLEIYDSVGNHIGTVKEEILTLMPRFALYQGERYLGDIRKRFTFFKPVFTLDYNGWSVTGNILEWDYRVTEATGDTVMIATKEIFNWTDTYSIEVMRPQDTLISLMIVLAIDAAKCSQGNG